MTHATVLGATGFIGSHLASALGRRGVSVTRPPRDADLTTRDLGVVFYCIGLTGDAAARPFDTVTAHVEKLLEVLRRCRFEQLVYLSSARVYLGAPTGTETETLRVDPDDPGRLFNLSKLVGESLVLASGRGRIARLSNVYGPDWTSDLFLPTIIRAASRSGVVALRDAADSAKDYLHVGDAVEALIHIALDGRERVWNVASGRNVTHGAIAEALRHASGCRVEFNPHGPTIGYPPIDTTRLRAGFTFEPRDVLDDMAWLVRDCRDWLARAGVPAAEG